MATKTPLIDLPTLDTCEGDGQREELACLAKADTIARQMVMAPLLDGTTAGDVVCTRLFGAIDKLSKTGQTEKTSIRDEWSYRIGLMTGLRLARALDGDMPSVGGAR